MIKNILIRRKESDTYLATVSRHRWSSWITMKKDEPSSTEEEGSSSSADEGHSAGWKLQYFIFFHYNPRTTMMSTDSSQVGVALFPLINIFSVKLNNFASLSLKSNAPCMLIIYVQSTLILFLLLNYHMQGGIKSHP